MGTRFKVFEATGVAPNGRLYAGDLNQMQDVFADQANFGQEIDVGSLGIGESTLKLLSYGVGEARLSGAFRTDGITRSLGGVYAGAFTTAERDAIIAGKRPYGLIILNKTTNQIEWNKGTDAAPSWGPISAPSFEVPVGGTMDWPWGGNLIPAGAVLPFGQTLSRAANPVLHNLAQQSGYPFGNGDGSTTFGIVDYRARVGAGKDDMGGTAAGRLTVGISGIAGTSLGAVGGSEGVVIVTAQIPAHNHPVSGAPGHNFTLPPHAHVDTLNFSDSGHRHRLSGQAFVTGGGAYSANVSSQASGGEVDAIYDEYSYAAISKSGGVGNPSSTPAIVGATTAGSLATTNTGGGAAHANVQPVVIVNKLMRAV